MHLATTLRTFSNIILEEYSIEEMSLAVEMSLIRSAVSAVSGSDRSTTTSRGTKGEHRARQWPLGRLTYQTQHLRLIATLVVSAF